MTDPSDRLAGLSRCQPKLAELADEVGNDPLLMLDVACVLLGEANRDACSGYCTEGDYVDACLRLARIQVNSIAHWREEHWSETLLLVADLIDRKDFEEEVSEDIRSLPGELL
jgi:hypothetical protein